MKKIIPIALLQIFFSFCSISQTYFQQHLDYLIHVRLDTANHSLKGHITIRYTNHSPDTLRYLYILLHPNSTSHPTKTALAKQLLQSNNWTLYFSEPSQRGYIDSLSFTVNSEPSHYKLLHDTPDVAILYLNKPLLPNHTVEIKTPFYVKIPLLNKTRMGYANHVYAITQWYPKPAVYDKEGWHPIPYLEMGEFYGEFARYTVHIEVPQHYTVAATGNLINEDEKKRIEQIVREQIVPFEKSENKYKTLTFVQDSVHDFAWFASPKFLINKDSVKINGNTVYCWAYYTPESKHLWSEAARYVAQSVKYYSDEVGAYPYQNCTAVETPNLINGGMEYPTITNIGKYDDKESLLFVILHEVGHNWFYGILASNERKYPWIDEGINSYYDNYGKYRSVQSSKNDWATFFNRLNVEDSPSQPVFDILYSIGQAQPMGLHTNKYDEINYYINAYINGETAWYLLRKQIGDTTYRQFMQSFFQEYKFKHIYPSDLKNHLTKFSAKNTDWFFDHYLYSTKRSDYKVKKIVHQQNSSLIIIKNKRSVPTPYTLTLVEKKQPILNTIREGTLLDTISISHKFDKVVINDQQLPWYFFEHNYQNNLYRNRRILPRVKDVSLRIGGIINHPDKYDVLLFPITTYTETDKSMAGLLLYSPVLPYAPFQIRLLPLYSIDKNVLNLDIATEYFYPINQSLKNFRVYGKYKQFSLPNNIHQKQWNKYQVGFELPFSILKDIKTVRIVPFAEYSASTYPYYPYRLEQYVKIGTQVHDKLFVYPVKYSITSEWHHDFSRLLFNAELFIPYNKKKKGILFEYFYGNFLYNNSRMYVYNFFLSGRNGITDYTYNDAYVARFSHIATHQFWAHQFVLSEGMFATYTPIQSNRWITSLRTSVALPIPPPICWYFTAATYHKAGTAWTDSTRIPYESGIEFRFIKHIFAVYFPIVMSNDVKQLSDQYARHYFDKVRFMIRFHLLNPLEQSKHIYELFQ